MAAAQENTGRLLIMVSDARKSTRGHLDAAVREAGEVAEKLIGSVLYNVGHRRWLRRGPAPRHRPARPARPARAIPRRDARPRGHRTASGQQRQRDG